MRTALLALALSAGPLAAGAAAQTPPPAPPAGMGHGGMHGMGAFGALMRADADGDGVVTRDEALAAADAAFDRLDANHDGIVSPDERRAMRPHGGPDAASPPPAGGMAAGLTRQQWRDRALRRFDRLDANHDGKVDRAEIAAFQAASRERRHERRAGGDMAPPPPPPASDAARR